MPRKQNSPTGDVNLVLDEHQAESFSRPKPQPHKREAVGDAIVELKTNEDHINKMEKKKNQMQEKHRKMAAEVKQTKLSMAKLGKENNDLKTAVDDLERNNSSLKAAVKKAKRRAWELEYDVRDLEQEVKTLRDWLRNSVALVGGIDKNPGYTARSALEISQEEEIGRLKGRIRDLEYSREGTQ
ncbi:hypothetical protein B0H67DRAFT_2066 [Lasiosphaeris hirsuta]|uniref:Uncharacterized protein n=1 Tax=Lasiosphaeris hirsuta TaxID=260670 RepID=A0AA40B8C6_9PEZI|nr:hypothetical protein B0H67DRAFT_2066 [Lasiosphaeris hirsuta]